MISNNPPVINAGADYTILRGLHSVKGTGTDAAGDAPYTWEQNDADNSSGEVQLLQKPDGPLFRSLKC
jgi:hypothetical protein